MKPNVIDVRTETFQQAVVERSRQTLVLVDFWAPWCGPCRMLTPTLEALAAEGEGRWVLAKINTDENQELARRYGVQGIPNVKAFKDGRVVDEFVGAQPRPAVEQFLARWLPDEIDEASIRAESLLEQGERQQARALLDELLKTQEEHPRANLVMARLCADEGDTEGALRHLERVPPRDALAPEARRLRAELRLVPNGSEGTIESLAAAVERDPGDLTSREKLAQALAGEERYEEAAEQLLEIIGRDRAYGDGRAREAMLDLFVLLGEHSTETERLRRRLSSLLFA